MKLLAMFLLVILAEARCQAAETTPEDCPYCGYGIPHPDET